MSDLNNPLFESQKEFLERQKQEYKNALLSDVQDLKEQSQKVGKTLLIAGGALAGVWMVSTLFRGKKKSKKLKAPQLALPAISTAPLPETEYHSTYSQEALNQEPVYPGQTTQGQTTQAPSALAEITRTIVESDMAKAITQQLTAFLLVYLTKKIEEYLADAAHPLAGDKNPETKDIDFSYHEEDAVS
ncbi:MAG: hypothetical protein ACO1O1_04900 [Adhaeribacter sp.]